MRNIAVLFSVVLLSVVAARADDPWTTWSANFNTVMTACVQANQPNCLAKAFQSQPRPPAPGSFVDDDLYRDLGTAEVLLHQTDASNAMYNLYGVDSSAYLGTGYSVPVAGTGAGNYTYALQREFFVPNLCAQPVNPKVCPKGNPEVWTFRLTAAQMTAAADKPIAALLRAHWPKTNGKALSAAWRATAIPGRPDLPPLLIRFASFPFSDYDGTFGRADAQRVFFASFGQVRTKTLRAAMHATGADSLLANPSPANTFFIWIYAPDPRSQASVATWKALFKLLEQPAP
jgi:hypothetical protein